MKYQHHHLMYEIDDEWLAEARADHFVANRDSYRPKKIEKEVFFVPIDSVEPLTERKQRRGIFCDDSESGLTARQRVVSILSGFVADAEIEPVEVVRLECGDFKYRLAAGCHRFHCAHAVGFVSVPATFKWSD